MVIPKKPTKDIDDFVNKGIDKIIRPDDQPSMPETIEVEKTKKRHAKRKKKPEKKVKMSFYMPESMYKKWKKYKGRKMIEGDTVTFQATVEPLIWDIINKKRS